MQLIDFIKHLRWEEKRSCFITIVSKDTNMDIYLNEEKREDIANGEIKYLKNLKPLLDREVDTFEFTGQYSDHSYNIILKDKEE